MAEYIDKGKALNLDFRININLFESRRKTAERAVQAYADAISKIPAAYVVEVVRCKDCIHRPSRIYGAGNDREGFNLEFPDDWCPMQCEDGWYNRMPRDDFFCSYGERKEKSNG